MRTGSATRMVRNEYAKMRHLRIGLIAAILLLGVCALTVLSALSSGLVNHRFDADGDGWRLLMASLHGAVGLTAPVPVPRLLALVTGLAAINLAVLGAQGLASARVENQLGPLALGLIGILLSVFAPVMPLWARYLSPWTAYGLIVPADFAGTDLVDLDTHLVGLTVLIGVGGALFALVTTRFDHQGV